MVKGSRCHDAEAGEKQKQESVAKHAEDGVIEIPGYAY